MARTGGLKKLVGVNLEDIDAREVNSIPMFDDVVVRVGRYGPYLERVRDGVSQRANLPDDLPPDELTAEVAEQLFAVPQEGRALGVDPLTGNEIVAKDGRYGPYVTEMLPDTSDASPKKKAKPRTGSLFKYMSVETVTWSRPSSCCRCRAWWASTPTAVRRSPRRTGATGRTSRRAPTRGR